MVAPTLLAFDTSIAVGSVAVGLGGELLASATLDERREHASRLVPSIEKVLERAAMRITDVGGIVVGEGPGSFTGVRVAAATAKGLAHALGVPLWAFSSLAAAALADRVLPRGAGVEGWWDQDPDEADGSRYVLFDARGDRVYAASHQLGRGGPLATLVPPHA